MQAEGLNSLFPMNELSNIDLFDILVQLPHLLGRLRETVSEVRRLRPAALVTIDSPKFNLRLAHRVRDLGIPLVHYAAPSVYAYAPGRAKAMAAFIDHLLLLFPFERPYFDAVGLTTTYVGPNILEQPDPVGDGSRFRRRHGLASDAPVLCVLPGSRRSEVRLLLSVFDRSVALLARRFPDLTVVVPTTSNVESEVGAVAHGWPGPAIVVTGADDRRDAIAAADAALTKAGTVTLELAAARVPSVVCGKLALLSFIQAVRGVSIKYIALPNWILDRDAVPEFRQYGCRPGPIADVLTELLTDPGARAAQQADLDEVMRLLWTDGRAPSEKAADAIMHLLSKSPALAEIT
jgi:lipid-A-disaccharide synthase